MRAVNQYTTVQLCVRSRDVTEAGRQAAMTNKSCSVLQKSVFGIRDLILIRINFWMIVYSKMTCSGERQTKKMRNGGCRLPEQDWVTGKLGKREGQKAEGTQSRGRREPPDFDFLDPKEAQSNQHPPPIAPIVPIQLRLPPASPLTSALLSQTSPV